ncbi:MAG: ABC transporter ATP-binding protein/permease [Lachnospiraceae bacterium]|nr:ABC transporter ATP-binding protein/permease [Lachnospiraceae bacterium]MCM1238288.1 ABC transporter ATP-binding protein/permease [Lachnospiraceae bacterium]
METRNQRPKWRQNMLDQIRDAADIHRKGLEMLRIIHGIDSSAIPLKILDAVVQVAGIYLGLFFTAGLIDSLLAAAFSRAFLYAGALILAELLLAGAGLLLDGAQDNSWNRLCIGFYIMVRDKAFSLDYETMEQPEVVDRIIRSERTASMYGGLNGTLSAYGELLESLLTIVMAVGLTVALCFARPVTESGILAVAAQPTVSLALAAVFICAVCVIYAKGNRVFSRKDEATFNSHTDVEIKLSYMLEHILRNRKAAKVIRIYDMKEMLLANFREFEALSLSFFDRWYVVSEQGALFQNTVNGTFVVCAYLFVAVKALAGAITIGTFTQYAGALTKLAKGFQNLVHGNTSLRKNCIYMEDLLAFLHTESSHAVGSIPVEKRLDGEYEIEFKDVSFHYPGSEEMVLKHVNCKLTTKDKMALVGRNGAGKTTFIKLLCRLYEPTEGSITLNGVDIRKYKEEEYRELFSVVFQDFKLFAFPVSDNLAAGYERDDARLRDCLERAGAAGFVRELPAGVDTLLYDTKDGGVEISGGEAQKLALARALYKDAPFVVLDEPTAALDPISEAQVYAGFDEMVKEKTSIYISHRMSSCRFCDDIIVFDQGRITERGSHEELLDRQGQYAEMWNAQAKYYME